jgi:O-methyltransferase
MSNQSITLDSQLYQYLLTSSLRESAVLKKLRDETAMLEMARMQIAPEQGQFMALLLTLMNASRYLEVGTFTGYSALVCAMALPSSGKVYALDNSAEWTAIAQRYWEEAGVADRIELRLGDAVETLNTMSKTDAGSIDMIFIDADKTGYAGYIEHAKVLLRSGGLLVLDNVLWGGRVADTQNVEADTVALRAVNQAMLNDGRFDISLLPVGDGLTLAVKR